MKKRILMLLGVLGINQHLNAQQKSDIAHAAYQVVPGTTAATGFSAMGVPASEWLVLASIGFVVLQALKLIWKWRREYLDEMRRERGESCARCEDDDDWPPPRSKQRQPAGKACAPAAETERV